MREETGLTVLNPRLCGVKQFPIENGRYLVFLFEATEYKGELTSSEEGTLHGVLAEQLETVNLVGDFEDLVQVMLDENWSEFQYVIDEEKWKIVRSQVFGHLLSLLQKNLPNNAYPLRICHTL